MSALREIFAGAAWVIAARWSIRGLGLISTLILARLLTPADFGVVAMAMFGIGLLEVFGETGLVMYIIRHPDPQRSHFDTVFTLRLLVGISLAALMVIGAPLAGVFFSEPRVTAVIRVLALRPLLLGLENPGIILFRKHMEFNKDFRFLVLNKVVAFITTVSLALAFRNYWALVFGILSGGLASTIQSYQMHPYRPRFSVTETRAVWSFSFWMLVQSLLSFLNARVDELIVGRIKSTVLMGYYTVGSDVASSPIIEVIAPLGRALFPGIVKLTDNPTELAEAFGKVMAGVAIVVLSFGTGIALVAADLTQVLLGPKWTPVVPLLRILALSASFLAMVQPLHTLLNAAGRPRISAMLSFIRQVMLVAAMVPAAIWFDLTAVAAARALVAVVTFALAAEVYVRLLRFPLASIWRNLLRPALATVAMSGVVLSVMAICPDKPLVRLALSIVAGAVSYTLALLALWQIAGRPDSVERDLLAVARTQIRSFAA
jgi:lipopolysaccharide exporter